MLNNQFNTTISHTPKESNEGNAELKGIKEIEHMRSFFPIVAMTYQHNPAKMYIDDLLKEKNIYVTVELNSENIPNHVMPKVWNRYKVFKNDICVFDAEDSAFPRKINQFTIGTWEEEFLDCIKQSKELYDHFYTSRTHR